MEADIVFCYLTSEDAACHPKTCVTTLHETVGASQQKRDVTYPYADAAEVEFRINSPVAGNCCQTVSAPSHDNTNEVRAALLTYQQQVCNKVKEWIKSTSCQPQELPEFTPIDNAMSVASTVSHNGSKYPWRRVNPLRASSSPTEDAQAAFMENVSQKLNEHLRDMRRQSEGHAPYEQRFAVC